MDVKRAVHLSVNLYQIEGRDQIYKWYDVPQKYQKLIKTQEMRHSKIEYICPNCATALKAEWEFVESVKCDVDKNYKGIYCTNIGSRKWTEMPEFTDRDYEDIQKITNNINNEIEKRVLKVKSDVQRVININTCPICGGILIKKYPFFIEDDAGKLRAQYFRNNPYWIKEKKPFDEYADLLKKEAEAEVWPFEKQADKFIKLCNVSSAPKVYKSENSTDFLKEYLLNLINLETNIMCMSKRLKVLYLLRGENDRDVAYEQNFPIFNFVKEIEAKNSDLVNLKQEKAEYERQPLLFKTVNLPQKPIKPEILKANLFNKKKIAALNAQAEAEYQEAVKKHLTTVEECKKQTEKNKAEAENQKKAKIKKYGERIDKSARDLAMAQHELNQRRANASDYPTPAAGKKYILDAEIATVEEALKNSFQCKNELYSYNIIFEKYRNIVAVSSFYEYLMAGRCDSLEGANGAYNIYENESRMDSIITKLDEIETKLDEIKANQFMVYNKLNSIESSLNSLNRTMKKAVSSLNSINANTATMSKYLENISNNTDVIAHNTAVSAYYSKVNAELTNALGFMVALN